MSYLTLEVQIDHGKVVPKEPEKLPVEGRGLLTILQANVDEATGKRTVQRVDLPLIRGDGSRIINPTPDDLDASLWD